MNDLPDFERALRAGLGTHLNNKQGATDYIDLAELHGVNVSDIQAA